MAITVNWPTKVINVPKADMLLIQSAPNEIRELDIDAFRLELKSIEAGVEGMPFVDTHSHSPPVTVGGVTLARVVEIINGYSVTFEDGQYAVNLAGANSNIGDVTNVNQVSVRSANSAGLTYSKEIEDQSFIDGRVWIDTANGVTGIQFPNGTSSDPVNNLADAQAIIANRGLPERLALSGLMVLTSGQSLASYNVLGESPTVSVIVSPFSNDFEMTTLRRIAITGSVSGDFTMQDGVIQNLSNFSGDCTNTGIGGTITLPATTASNAIYTYHNCFSIVPGTDTPILDCNNAADLAIQFRGYAGGIEIRNYTDSNNRLTIDLLSGNVVIDSSCTAGTIVLRGVGSFTDNSGVGCTVINTGMTFGTSGLTATESTQLSQIDTLRKLMQNRMETDPTTGVLTIYDDDDTTVFLQGNIYEDVLASQIYRGSGIERRNRLT